MVAVPEEVEDDDDDVEAQYFADRIFGEFWERETTDLLALDAGSLQQPVLKVSMSTTNADSATRSPSMDSASLPLTSDPASPLLPPSQPASTITATPPPFSLLDEEHHDNLCWGLSLKHLASCCSDAVPCTVGFVAGKGHLKNKFCAACRASGISVPLSHMGALTPELEMLLVNDKTPGLWTRILLVGHAPLNFRVIKIGRAHV